MKPDCFGWILDRQALNDACTTCELKDDCRKDWELSGGRLGGYFDRARESQI